MKRQSIGIALVLIASASLPITAAITAEESAVLQRLQIPRVLAGIRHLSEEVVKNDSGVGAGSAVAGSDDERALADDIAREMQHIGLAVHQESFPVRRYDYAPVRLTAGG